MNVRMGMIAAMVHVVATTGGGEQTSQSGSIITGLFPFFFMLAVITIFVVVRFIHVWKDWKKILEDEKKAYTYKKKIPKKKRGSRKW